ncbi:helix-turn-helix domain-containing protein [Bacillus methanolicus]|uniref:Transcriptional regulator, XRE family protein n=1 Tax=Bacillus methanolicus (strain MGA3 / ATCC 53907) TaxID=796606 RepID=I3DZI3_BACMM|nr:helix-turn-helix domain-containing protein [Bacillus methanolicus]AIE59723.1 transcriptional regulator, XRE family protein [Bacillus methanolicus MGA3]EIJ79654.1 HTH XRE-family DNA-binding protein [Bacillus methanolicus MGA3]
MTELGNRLKEAREAKGLSLDQLQDLTKIQKRYLKGIEEGNYSMMPGKFYVRAFIKQYAEAVGIEPEELFEEYKNEIPATYDDELPEQLSRVQSRKRLAENTSKIFDILPKILIGVFVIGAITLIWYLLQSNARNETKEPVKEENVPARFEQSAKLEKNAEESKKTEKQKKEKTSSDESKTEVKEKTQDQQVSVVQANGRNTVYELKNADKFLLKVASTGGDTWVNILNGKGYSFFQGILSKGGTESQTVDLSKEKEAVIVIGNTANTEIYINDQKVEFAVPPSESVRQDITIRYVPKAE